MAVMSSLLKASRSLAFSGSSLLAAPPTKKAPSFNKWKKQAPDRLGVVARIKRRKDAQLDKVVDRDKKVRLVTKVKELLCKQPGRKMSLKQLGLFRKQVGLTGKRRCIVLLRKYSTVFELFNSRRDHTLWFRLAPAAEQQYLLEQQLQEQMEEILVNKVRKMLMMSLDGRLSLQNILHLRRDFGLPETFRQDMVKRYPQYWVVKEDPKAGPYLELTAWDPALAVSAAEEKAARNAATLAGLTPSDEEIRAQLIARAAASRAPEAVAAASERVAAREEARRAGREAKLEQLSAEMLEEDSRRRADAGGGSTAAWRAAAPSPPPGAGPGASSVAEPVAEGAGDESDGDGQVLPPSWSSWSSSSSPSSSWEAEGTDGEEEAGEADGAGEAGSAEGEEWGEEGQGQGQGQGQGSTPIPLGQSLASSLGKSYSGLSGEELARAAIAAGKEAVGAGTFGFAGDPDRKKHGRRVNLNLPAGYRVSRKDLKELQKFQELPAISPYAPAGGGVRQGTREYEKRTCAIVHEMLSLTLEKRLLVDHFTHFRKSFMFTARLRGMIVRHPELFYVSEKGHRHSVFLREAYNGETLIDKDPLVLALDKLRSLVADGQRRQRLNTRDASDDDDDDDADGDEGGSEDEDEEDAGDEDEEVDDWDDVELERGWRNLTELKRNKGGAEERVPVQRARRPAQRKLPQDDTPREWPVSAVPLGPRRRSIYRYHLREERQEEQEEKAPAEPRPVERW